jgi:predicted enzyme related to lactoylglutathione lyase
VIWALAMAAASVALSAAPAPAAQKPNGVGVGAQYDSSHVYVAAADIDRFVDSFVATFGGKSTSRTVLTITPTPSSTIFRAVLTPAGLISAFGFTTPVPYPFGMERTGYLVTDLDAAVRAARANGASVVVAPFPDPIGRDAIVLWPGGVFMQLYWHRTPPSYPPLAAVPENRIYLSPDKAVEFVRDFLGFAKGKVTTDDAAAPGIEVGNPKGRYRRIRIDSVFGKTTLLVTDGHLPYPYGRETTGYAVADLASTLEKAERSGATVLVKPYRSGGRQAAVVRFPGGYIAEIHAGTAR